MPEGAGCAEAITVEAKGRKRRGKGKARAWYAKQRGGSQGCCRRTEKSTVTTRETSDSEGEGGEGREKAWRQGTRRQD